mgnify:CR=1 FL=1
MIVNKNWFFTITKTAIARGTRFLSDDRPNKETMQNLVDTMVSKNPIDKAKENSSEDVTNLAGHVVASTSVQAITFQTPLLDRTLSVQPYQLPETVKSTDTAINLTDTTYGPIYTDIILDISNVNPTIRNVYTHKITANFSNWLASILSNISIALKNAITQISINTSNIAANTTAISGLTSGTFNGTLPIGALTDFGGIADPNVNFLLCDGRSLVRSSYPALFAVISNRFGDGVTPGSTFALPNYNGGKTSKGLDSTITAYNTIGKIGGNNNKILTIYDLPAHKHGAGLLFAGKDVGNSHSHYMALGSNTASTTGGDPNSLTLANTNGIFTPGKLTGNPVGIEQQHTHNVTGQTDYQYDPSITPQTVIDLNTPFVIVNKIIRAL